MRKGITLLELLVAIVLTGIIGFIVFQMFLGENKNYTTTRAKIKLQTDSREAMRIMEEELKNAGYRLSHWITVVSEKQSLQTLFCPEGVYSETSKISLSSEPINTYSILFRMYAPKPGSLEKLDCKNDRVEIAYQWDKESKTLFRWYSKGEDGVDLSKPGVPFLENVTDFKVEFGRKTGYEMLVSKNELTNEMIVSNSSSLASVIKKSSDGSIDSWVSSGWSTNESNRLVIKKDIKLDASDNNKIVLNVTGNSAFLKDVTGRKYSRFVLCREGNCIGDANRIVLPFTPTVSSSDDIVYKFSVNNTGTYQLALEAAVKSVTSNIELTISALQLVRIDNGQYGDWFQKNDIVDQEQWANVRAIRLTVATEAKTNNQSVVTRIIPVVNNEKK